MAHERIVDGVRVKVRSPWGVWGLAIVTLGIYGIVYWYLVNRELCDYSAAAGAPLGNDPMLSVLALIPGGWIIVPPLVSAARTATRTRRCLSLSSGTVADGPSALITVLLSLLFSLHLVYLQRHVNRIWESAGSGGLTDPTLATF